MPEGPKPEAWKAESRSESAPPHQLEGLDSAVSSPSGAWGGAPPPSVFVHFVDFIWHFLTFQSFWLCFRERQRSHVALHNFFAVWNFSPNILGLVTILTSFGVYQTLRPRLTKYCWRPGISGGADAYGYYVLTRVFIPYIIHRWRCVRIIITVKVFIKQLILLCRRTETSVGAAANVSCSLYGVNNCGEVCQISVEVEAVHCVVSEPHHADTHCSWLYEETQLR